MMRALWTGASGMKAQQTNVDTIANNLANVNTVGYKSQSTQFKSLLYQTLRTETTTANGENKPTTAQVGLGARVASTNTDYTQGTMQANASKTALCISGSGFFAVRGADNGPIIPEVVILHGHWIIWVIVFWLHLRDRKSWIIRAIRSCCRMALRAMRFPLERMVLWHIRQQTAPIYRPGSRWHCTSSTIQKDWKRPGTAF